jgi:hypothetical protein
MKNSKLNFKTATNFSASKSLNAQKLKILTSGNKILSIGFLDLEMTLNLSELDMTIFKLEYEKLQTLEGFKSVIESQAELLDNFILTSKNSLLTSLIYLNKTQNQNNKFFIEFLSLNKLNLLENEKFILEIFKYVAHKNLLYVTENDFIKCNCEIRIIIKFPRKEKIIFTLGTKEKFIYLNNENYESKILYKVGNILSQLKSDYSQYSYLFINLNDFIQNANSGENEKKLKSSSSSNDFNKISFENLSALQSINDLLLEIYIKFKKLKMIIEFPEIINNIDCLSIQSIPLILDICSYADFLILEKKDSLAFIRMNYEYKNFIFAEDEKNYAQIQKLNMSRNTIHKKLNSISLSPSKSFNDENKNINLNSIDLNNNINFSTLNTKNSNSVLEEFFISEIKFKSGVEVHKFPKKSIMYIDDLNKVLILEKNLHNKLTFHYEYIPQIHPRINYLNIDLVKQFKKHLLINYPELRAIFQGGFFSNYIRSENYSSCLCSGQEITKRILELYKTGTDLLLNSKFYIVNLNDFKIQEIENYEKNEIRRKKFVLDCVNRSKSSKKGFEFFNKDNFYKYSRQGSSKGIKTGRDYNKNEDNLLNMNSNRSGMNEHMHSSKSFCDIFNGENISQPLLELNKNQFIERKLNNNFNFSLPGPNLPDHGRNHGNNLLNNQTGNPIKQTMSLKSNLNFFSTLKNSKSKIDSKRKIINPENSKNSSFSLHYMNDYKYEIKSVVNRRNSLILKQTNEDTNLKKSGSTLSIPRNKLFLPKID